MIINLLIPKQSSGSEKILKFPITQILLGANRQIIDIEVTKLGVKKRRKMKMV